MNNNKLYVIATQVHSAGSAREQAEWRTIHVTTRLTEEGVAKYIDHERDIDTTYGGLIAPSKPGTVRYKVLECAIAETVYIDKTKGARS